jgi:hypothetical protein
VSRKKFRRSLAVFAALVACAVMILATPPARAGGCYGGASYAYGYSASYYPTTSYPVSYSYYTPTVYYPKYEVQEVVVPKAVKAYQSPDYFSSVSDYYRDRMLVDAIAGKGTDLTKLQQELSELKAAIKQGQTTPQQPAPQPNPAYYAPAPAPLPPQQYQQAYQQQGGHPV